MKQDISRLIMSLREAAGLTQTELAKRAGFSSSGTISQFELGIRTPSIDSLEKIAEVCGAKLTITFNFADDNDKRVYLKKSDVMALEAIVKAISEMSGE